MICYGLIEYMFDYISADRQEARIYIKFNRGGLRKVEIAAGIPYDKEKDERGRANESDRRVFQEGSIVRRVVRLHIFNDCGVD